MYQDMLTCIRINHDQLTLGNVLAMCAEHATLKEGKEVHAYIIPKFGLGVTMGSALVAMYEKCGDGEDSLNVFEKFLERNVVS